MFSGWWENSDLGFEDDSVSHNLESESRDAQQSFKGGIIAILRH